MDDLEFNILAIKTLLIELNFSADICFNGQEAIDIVKTRNNQSCGNCNSRFYDLILMDIDMPI